LANLNGRNTNHFDRVGIAKDHDTDQALIGQQSALMALDTLLFVADSFDLIAI
jgi:hypothetical protein